MSEQVQKTSQQTLAIGLGIIAVLLVAIIGLVVYFQGQSNAIPDPTAQAGTGNTPTSATTTATAPAGMGAGSETAFDAKTATKVPKGTEPDAYVKAYYQACEDGDWQKAFDLLPASKKAGNSPDALKEQVGGYGIESFKVTGSNVSGNKATVKVDQVTGQYGTFENTWTFVKGDGGVWLVEGKAVTGMK